MNECDLPSPYWRLPAVICLLGALCVAALWHRRFGGPKSLPLPPQPRGSWMLGNLSEVINASSESLQHLLMQDWSRQHGEVFRVRLGPVTEYFLNSDRAVKVEWPLTMKQRERFNLALIYLSAGDHGSVFSRFI